jgi:hypothetical protein
LPNAVFGYYLLQNRPVFLRFNKHLSNLQRIHQPMYKSVLTRRRLIFLVALLSIASYGIYRATADDPPTEQYLFVIDERSDKNTALTLSDVFTKDEEKRTKNRIVVKVISPGQILATAAALEQAYADYKLANPPQKPSTNPGADQDKELQELRPQIPISKLFFIELNPPYTDSKKALRQAIDLQDRFTGHERAKLLGSTVPVLRPEPYAVPHGCQQLADDFAYMNWSFHGVGLHLNEAAIRMLNACKPYG